MTWRGTVDMDIRCATDATTEEPPQVDIFARNPRRAFYRRHGFREHGEEFEHEFRADVSLPVQPLRLAREETARSGFEGREQRS